MKKKKESVIFIVEDNQVYRQALKTDIESTFPNIPLRVRTFQTGESCLECLQAEHPQIVILDYNLNSKFPDAADGIAILDKIKKENNEIHVILLTSEDHLDIAVKSFKHGAFDYIVKAETTFRKINSSLFNLFKMIEAGRESVKYKRIATGLFLCIVLFIGGVIAVQIFAPSLLK
jgi:DNA-binding NtrC family response regulator